MPQAGLPNITGNFDAGYEEAGFTAPQGAFSSYTVAGASNEIPDINGMPRVRWELDASKSSAVYGKSDTVQPPSYTVFYIMKTNKDFHYSHTNPASSTPYYTKDEVDNLLSEYLKKTSKDYVRNLTNNYVLGLGYSATDKSLHGYVGSTEVPLGSQGDSELPVNSNKGYFRIGKTLVQYGRELKPVSSAVTDKIFFPIPFNNLQSISITPVAANPATLDIGHNLREAEGSVGVFHMDNTGFDVIYGDDFNGVYIHWIAIGT